MPTQITMLTPRIHAPMAALLLAATLLPNAPARAADPIPLSPTALAATRDGQTLFIACSTDRRVLRFHLPTRSITGTTALPAPPTGLALSPDDTQLYITCADSESKVCVLDPSTCHLQRQFDAGHTAIAPVLSPDGHTLYVCNRFGNSVSVIDVPTGQTRRVLPTVREPVAAALTHDGRFLLVANLLHNDPADATNVAAVVSILNTASGAVHKELRLPDGSGSLQDIRISPDGRLALVTHIISRHRMPATQLDRGWMNTNGGSLIDLQRLELITSFLLDSVDAGAANPWGIAWLPDSSKVVIAHAGTHELSILDVPGLLARFQRLPTTPPSTRGPEDIYASRTRADVPNDLAFLVGLRHRIRLPATDRGPRAVALAGSTVYVANYFSDTLTALDPTQPQPALTSIPLGPTPTMTPIRQGEFYFHDASICFQGWQSCASCHPSDARVDALNWDLLNDGIGNPKNNKSLLLSHRTPPAMSLGVRDTAETAVRAGIRHILFTVQPPEVADTMDAYLKALEPTPSPFLVQGKLSPAALRGARIFQAAACADCHPPDLFTDLNHYNVGTRNSLDQPDDIFDTPTLIELWRTAPYLHDGSAASLREVFTTKNPNDHHGRTSQLSPAELDDLCAYLLSL